MNGKTKFFMKKLSKEERFFQELKQEILDFFEVNENRSLSFNQVHKAFAINDQSLKEIYNRLVTELHAEGMLIRKQDGTYYIDKLSDMLVGKIDHVTARQAFLIPDDSSLDVIIQAQNLNGAIDGDTVKILVWPSRKREKRREGEVIEVVERGRSEIVGMINVTPYHAFVKPDARRIYEEIFVRREDLNGAKKGEKVLVKISQYPEANKRMEGVVSEVLGVAGENNTEMHAILAEFGLPIRFPKNIEDEAEKITEKISKAEISKRRDFRKTLTFTIDPADAKDFDDAISFEYLENGNYEIGVHIADVTHYITPDSLLEKEAFKRATSIYLVDRVVPMLPEKLSNNLCSLRPNEDKLTFSAVFEIDTNAKIIKEWFGRTIIHSDKRFSYEEAQELLENLQKGEKEIEDRKLVEMEEGDRKKGSGKKKQGKMANISLSPVSIPPVSLHILNDLAKKLREDRFRKGSVNFDTVEVRFSLDENGKPLAVVPKIRKDSHKLIEEFMLLANKKVAEFVHNLSKKEPRNTMVYRVHEPPNPEKMTTFANFARRFGHEINTSKIASSLNKLMTEVQGKPEQNLFESLAIRTMAKARYSTQAIGHFGLAFPFYSHFTSPIRRYPDMMAHRLLQHYLDGGASVDKVIWEQRCKHSSDMERMANEAERASIKYKQVEFMSGMIGQEFQGIISGVAEFGIFVEITETSCEGMVRMGDLKDDFYQLDKENYRIIGERSGRVLTFGDSVRVQVKSCDLGRRSMDLSLIELTHSGKVKKIATRFDKTQERRKSKNTQVIPKGEKREPRRK